MIRTGFDTHGRLGTASPAAGQTGGRSVGGQQYGHAVTAIEYYVAANGHSHSNQRHKRLLRNCKFFMCATVRLLIISFAVVIIIWAEAIRDRLHWTAAVIVPVGRRVIIVAITVARGLSAVAPCCLWLDWDVITQKSWGWGG